MAAPDFIKCHVSHQNLAMTTVYWCLKWVTILLLYSPCCYVIMYLIIFSGWENNPWAVSHRRDTSVVVLPGWCSERWEVLSEIMGVVKWSLLSGATCHGIPTFNERSGKWLSLVPEWILVSAACGCCGVSLMVTHEYRYIEIPCRSSIWTHWKMGPSLWRQCGGSGGRYCAHFRGCPSIILDMEISELMDQRPHQLMPF